MSDGANNCNLQKFVSAPKIHKRTKINLSLFGVNEKSNAFFFTKILPYEKIKFPDIPKNVLKKKFIYQLHKKIELKKLFPSNQIICSWRFVLWLKG